MAPFCMHDGRKEATTAEAVVKAVVRLPPEFRNQVIAHGVGFHSLGELPAVDVDLTGEDIENGRSRLPAAFVAVEQ